jgi:hypothetical protein
MTRAICRRTCSLDSLPKRCLACRRDLRTLRTLRRRYHDTVAHIFDSGDLASKEELAEVIDHMYEFGGELPSRINEVRRRLARQIAGAGDAA